MKFTLKFLGLLLSRIKDYFDHSSIHGLRYITKHKINITERLFWLGTCISALYGTCLLFQASWYNFQNKAVTFVVDTAYLHWNTTFPAVSVCDNESPDIIFEAGKSLFGKGRSMNMDFFLRDIAFFDGTCYTCKTHCGKTMNCSMDLDILINKVRAKCNHIFAQCSWNGEPFDCCSEFLPLATETGVCYSLNSLHTESAHPKTELYSNQFTGPGKLDLRMLAATKVYIHAREDVPYINHPQEESVVLNWGTNFVLTFHEFGKQEVPLKTQHRISDRLHNFPYTLYGCGSKKKVAEISNDPMLRKVSVDQRQCKFPVEGSLGVYSYYSYSACVVNCRAKAQVRFCNCTHHFMPKQYGVPTCKINGLICLTAHSETLHVLKVKGYRKKGLICKCIPSCTEPEYTIISRVSTQDEESGMRISIVMDTLPSKRFKRNVVRTRLDLVVRMGGAAGLFLGASLLSIAELIIILTFGNSSAKGKKESNNEIHQEKNKRFFNDKKVATNIKQLTFVESHKNNVFFSYPYNK